MATTDVADQEGAVPGPEITEIYEGTSEIQRMVIARSILRD